MEDKIYTIELTVLRQIYYNNDNCFGVYLVYTKEKYFDFQQEETITNSYKIFNADFDNACSDIYTCKLTGNHPELNENCTYKVECKLVYNNKYKETQLGIVKAYSVAPKSTMDQFNYLCALVSPRIANALLTVYPNLVNDIIADNSYTIDCSKVKGVGKPTFEKIKHKIITNYCNNDLFAMLTPLGIDNKRISTLLSKYDSPAMLKHDIETDPYTLTKLHGMGFASVDKLALKINPKFANSPERAIAFIKNMLMTEAESNGHTVIALDDLKNAAKTSIPECREEYVKIIRSCREATASDDQAFLYCTNDLVGLRKFYDQELFIKDDLEKRLQYSVQLENAEEVIANAVSITNAENGYDLTQEQTGALHNCSNYMVSLITGCAGTGKSSSIKGIINMFDKSRIKMAALSAKAAQRMVEVTKLEATTIHRLLGYDGNKFVHNDKNQIDGCDLLIIDEASMINTSLFYALLLAIPVTTRIVIVFDFAQLAPIGAGNVASDLLNMNMLPTTKFTKIHRQAEASGILVDANIIREGEFPITDFVAQTHGALQDIHYEFIEEGDNEWTFETINKKAVDKYKELITQGISTDDITIITPRKQKCMNSTRNINEQIQKFLLGDETLFVNANGIEFKNGAKVIQRVNNYDKDVVNGEVGYITNISNDGQLITIDFGNNKVLEFTKSDMETFELAYALTVHSFQGSECKYVIICLDISHYNLLDSCLLYTAITRAKKDCYILAQPKAFTRAIQNNGVISRNTFLNIVLNNVKL